MSPLIDQPLAMLMYKRHQRGSEPCSCGTCGAMRTLHQQDQERAPQEKRVLQTLEQVIAARPLANPFIN